MPTRDLHDEIRQPLRALLKPFGPDYWRGVDAERAFPKELFDAFGEAGYFGTLIDEAYGGSNAGAATASIVVEEINRAGGDASVVNAQMAICGALARAGSDEQKQRWLPAIAAGEVRMLMVAATEPDSGADMSSLQSSARRDGDDWIVTAKKVMISLAEHTRLGILLVKTEQGPTLFLLDFEEHGAGIELQPIEMITNRMTSMLFIDEMRLPNRCLLGEPGQGLKALMGGFAPRRVFAAAESIGNARFLLEKSLEHAKTRVTFDRPIGQNQGVQYPLTKAYGNVEAADLMRWDALGQIEAGAADAAARSALAKILASEAAWETARAALTTFGGWGLAGEYHVERKLRDCTVFVFNNLLTSFVAERVLGLPKAY